MHTPETIEKSLQHCFLALYRQDSVEKRLQIYTTFFATHRENDVPACQRKYYLHLKQTLLTTIGTLEQCPQQSDDNIFVASLMQKMLLQLLVFYRETCGWLAVEDYIACRNNLLYNHALCD